VGLGFDDVENQQRDEVQKGIAMWQFANSHPWIFGFLCLVAILAAVDISANIGQGLASSKKNKT